MNSKLEVELARITSHRLPAVPRKVGAVRRELSLRVDQLEQLYNDGWLSFSPDDELQLDEAREAELSFVGSIFSVIPDTRHLHHLLSGLVAPYAYDSRSIYFDFHAGAWRLYPFMQDPEEAFFVLLEHLNASREDTVLRDVRRWVDEALDLTHSRKVFFNHLMHQETPEGAKGTRSDRRGS